MNVANAEGKVCGMRRVCVYVCYKCLERSVHVVMCSVFVINVLYLCCLYCDMCDICLVCVIRVLHGFMLVERWFPQSAV